ncbi:MAG: hypothetical protein DGJ47_000727 [Rickettsiaceae bacterium]
MSHDDIILITGGAGFIGTNFILNRLKKPFSKLINLDLLTYAADHSNLQQVQNNSAYHFVQGDINDKELVANILQKYQPNIVVHFAAESHVDRSISSPAQFIHTNINGTYNLLECSKSYWENLSSKQRADFRFIHISTDEVYGSLNQDEPSFTEESAYKPNSPYSASKAASDHLVRSWYHTYGFPAIITNCSNNYGPYQNQEKLIPCIINSALKGQKIPIYGDGQNIRDWLHVKDHCEAINKVIDKGQLGQSYNVGACNELTNLQVAKYICQALDQMHPEKHQEFGINSYLDLISFVDDRLGHDRRYAVNPCKIQKELSWKAKINFQVGIKETILHYVR